MKKVLFLTMLLMSVSVASQSQNEYNNLFLDPNSPHAKTQVKVVEDLKEFIGKRLNELSQKQPMLAYLSPETKEKLVIVTEDNPYQYDKGYESDIYKYIAFDFSGGKVTKVTIGSKIKRLQYETGFENKLITYDPANYNTSNVKVEVFDKTTDLPISQMSIDNQIKSLKTILTYINIAAYKVEMIILTKREKKELEAVNLLDI